MLSRAASGVGSGHVCASPVCSDVVPGAGPQSVPSLGRFWALPSFLQKARHLKFKFTTSDLKVKTGFCALSPLSSEMACFFPVSPWVHLINYKANVIYYLFSSGANPDIHAARVNSRAEFIKLLSWWPSHDINLEGFRGDQYFTLFLFVFFFDAYLNLLLLFFNLCIHLLASLHDMWDLRSPTGFEPSSPAKEPQILNHWTTREVPWSLFLNRTEWN